MTHDPWPSRCSASRIDTHDRLGSATIVLVPAAVAAAPVLASWLGRVVRIPLVVFEIAFGILLGPGLLGWVSPDEIISRLADFGLAMLFFLAGSEIDVDRIRGRVLNRSILGWLVALVAGLAVGICVGALLGYGAIAGVFIGIALTSTALGTIMPVLRDAGELHTPFGTAVIGIGTAGEFGPLIAISLFLSGRNPGTAALVLLAFALVAATAIIISARGRHHHLHAMITTTLRTSGQFAVRFVILIVAALVALSLVLGLDMLLGAFAAGLVVRFVLDDATPADREAVETKLEAVGFGFLVPVFFVVTGLRFDLQALTSNPTALLLLALFAVLLLLVRGLTGLFTAPSGASARDRRAIVLLTATGLPIIVAVTDIGTTTGDLPAALASALVGAGMLSVLLFPLIALAQRRTSRSSDKDIALTVTTTSPAKHDSHLATVISGHRLVVAPTQARLREAQAGAGMACMPAEGSPRRAPGHRPATRPTGPARPGGPASLTTRGDGSPRGPTTKKARRASIQLCSPT